MYEMYLFPIKLFLQEDAKESLRQVQKFLLQHPDQADLWYRLSATLLRNFPYYGRAITNTAGCALALDSRGIKVYSKSFMHLFAKIDF